MATYSMDVRLHYFHQFFMWDFFSLYILYRRENTMQGEKGQKSKEGEKKREWHPENS